MEIIDIKSLIYLLTLGDVFAKMPLCFLNVPWRLHSCLTGPVWSELQMCCATADNSIELESINMKEVFSVLSQASLLKNLRTTLFSQDHLLFGLLKAELTWTFFNSSEEIKNIFGHIFGNKKSWASRLTFPSQCDMLESGLLGLNKFLLFDHKSKQASIIYK